MKKTILAIMAIFTLGVCAYSADAEIPTDKDSVQIGHWTKVYGVQGGLMPAALKAKFDAISYTKDVGGKSVLDIEGVKKRKTFWKAYMKSIPEETYLKILTNGKIPNKLKLSLGNARGDRTFAKTVPPTDVYPSRAGWYLECIVEKLNSENAPASARVAAFRAMRSAWEKHQHELSKAKSDDLSSKKSVSVWERLRRLEYEWGVAAQLEK